jgi:hypothetical protein
MKETLPVLANVRIVITDPRSTTPPTVRAATPTNEERFLRKTTQVCLKKLKFFIRRLSNAVRNGNYLDANA